MNYNRVSPFKWALVGKNGEENLQSSLGPLVLYYYILKGAYPSYNASKYLIIVTRTLKPNLKR